MKKTAAEDAIEVKIGRFNESTVTVSLPENATLQDLLDKSEKELASNESLFVDGEEATLDDVLENDDVVQIVGNKEGGR